MMWGKTNQSTNSQPGARPKVRSRRLVLLIVAGIAALVLTAFADDDLGSIFRPFRDDSGFIQTLPNGAGPGDLNAQNAFFDASVGTNGQACATCHQPAQGLTIHVHNIRDAFNDTQGLDPLFRLNDTADRPDADVSTLAARRTAYKLFLNIGVVRIGKPFKANSNPNNPSDTVNDFRIDTQNTAQFGPLPSLTDPQHPGIPTLSVFRRPLVNTNVNLDSAVLWDGRDSIGTIDSSQVPKAVQSLLLGSGTDLNANQQIADFMLGVFTDQVFDTRSRARRLSADGATGGTANLLALVNDPARPCLYKADFPTSAPVLSPFSPSGCTKVDANNPHTFGSDLFEAWQGLHSDEGTNEGRAAIARGEIVFNTADLTAPPDLDGKLLDVASVNNGGANADHPDKIPAGTKVHCVTCHASHNLGNNPNPNFIGRIGTDSLDILANLVATRSAQDPRVANVLARAQMLPVYCLRPKSDPNSFTVSACGNDPGDVKTTDPGRALVTGLIADSGKFKPPILRGLAARSPYFHAGTANDIFDVIDFYDARFQINLTPQQKRDLAAFLEAF